MQRGKQKVCGCRVAHQRGKGGRMVPVAVCRGTPMRRILSKEQADQFSGAGEFCTMMIRPASRKG